MAKHIAINWQWNQRSASGKTHTTAHLNVPCYILEVPHAELIDVLPPPSLADYISSAIHMLRVDYVPARGGPSPDRSHQSEIDEKERGTVCPPQDCGARQ